MKLLPHWIAACALAAAAPALSQEDPSARGRALLEALALGAPVVASDIGPNREVLGAEALGAESAWGEGAAGVTFRSEDPAALAAALNALLQDEAQRERAALELQMASNEVERLRAIAE